MGWRCQILGWNVDFSEPKLLCSLPLIISLLIKKVYEDIVSYFGIKALLNPIVKGKCDVIEEK